MSCELLHVSWNVGFHMPYEQAELLSLDRSYVSHYSRLPPGEGRNQSTVQSSSSAKVHNFTQEYNQIDI
jgi:hypothetical protein